MLERRLADLLKIIDNTIGLSYKVVDKQELLSMLDAQCHSTMAQLDSAINYLTQREYIAVKYSDDAEICLASTVKGRAQIEHGKSNAVRSKISGMQFWTMFGIVLLASFIGSLLANFVTGGF